MVLWLGGREERPLVKRRAFLFASLIPPSPLKIMGPYFPKVFEGNYP